MTEQDDTEFEQTIKAFKKHLDEISLIARQAANPSTSGHSKLRPNYDKRWISSLTHRLAKLR